MARRIEVLDGKGFVELLDTFGDDITVVNAARVSLAKESNYEEDGSLKPSDAGLISYLAKHKHDSPFFHPQVRCRIKMPISIAREHFRHVVGFARNEISRRYVTATPECFIPNKLRKRAPNVKQGSSDESVQNEDELRNIITEHANYSVRLYENLLSQGVCPEQARLVLPQSMYTEFIETGSLAAYARLYGLRSQPDAQREIQEYANAIATLLKDVFPVSWEALTK